MGSHGYSWDFAGGRGGRKELITKTEEKLSSRSTWPHPRLPRGPPGCQGKFGVCFRRCRCDLVTMPSLPLAACRAWRRHQEFLGKRGAQILTGKSSWIRLEGVSGDFGVTQAPQKFPFQRGGAGEGIQGSRIIPDPGVPRANPSPITVQTADPGIQRSPGRGWQLPLTSCWEGSRE